MPELREIFDKVTKQAEPDLGSWQQQEERQRRSVRKRRLGAYGLVAALIVALAAFALTSLRSGRTGVAVRPPSPSAVGLKTTPPIGAQIVRDDGTPLRQLHVLPAGAQGLRLSPDGGQIAFRLGGQIATIRTDGTGLTIVTKGAGTVATGIPSWSPDGNQIAYPSKGDIYVIDTDGSGGHTIVRLPGPDDDPAWSPDGSTIAFSHGGDAIYTVPAAGGPETRLASVQPGDGATEPAWSPDGREIAYQSRATLWVMRSDGTKQHQLLSYDAAGDSSAPAWSPDGTKLAFITFTTYSPDLRPLKEVRILDLATGHASSLHMTVATDLNGPQWVSTDELLVNRYG
jgi:dipeptidyl aminopeptidase/acylaminoacyl peptidase